VINVLANRPGVVSMEASFFDGPSLASPGRTMTIATDSGFFEQEQITTGQHTLEIPVDGGQNTVRIRVLDVPSIAALPNGDTRPLLLGMTNVSIRLLSSI
jgi:hypothetical protein